VIAAVSDIRIGREVLIGEHSSVRDSDHQSSAMERSRESRSRTTPVRIGDGVWIGAGCRILRGSDVGSGATVGANSVVKGLVEPDSVVAGAPARPVHQ
jgi:acetyltransferase-like isoleucine patch superfamily enzyme